MEASRFQNHIKNTPAVGGEDPSILAGVFDYKLRNVIGVLPHPVVFF